MIDIEDVIKSAYDPEEVFKLKMYGFLNGELEKSKSLFEHMPREELVANAYPAEKRHSLALNLVLEYAELVAKGTIDPNHYVDDIIKVRKAGKAYAMYLMICYAKSITDTVAYVYRLATNAKEEGKLHIKGPSDLNISNAPLAMNVDKMNVLNRLSRYFAPESFSTAASRVTIENIGWVN